MTTKIFIVIALVLMFDPCNRPGKKVTFADFCNTENFDEFVHITGYLTDNGLINCEKVDGTYPSCKMYLRESPESKGLIMVSIEQGRNSSGLKGTETVREFDDLEIFDRSGEMIDHVNKAVTLSGRVQIDHLISDCILRVRRIEQK